MVQHDVVWWCYMGSYSSGSHVGICKGRALGWRFVRGEWKVMAAVRLSVRKKINVLGK